jgi:hypothetical protein
MSKDHDQPEAAEAAKLLQMFRRLDRELKMTPALSEDAQRAVDAYAKLSSELAVDRFVPRKVDPKETEDEQRRAKQHNVEAEAFTKIVESGK